MNQARALGASFASLPIQAIYCSPLKRAYDTALQILERQDPIPEFVEQSDLLKEQHFGSVEGQPWAASRSSSAALHYSRADRYPDGESRDDVAARASRAVNHLLMPHIINGKGHLEHRSNVVIVSHGIFLSELIRELFGRRACGQNDPWRSSGLVNTGWTRLVLGFEDEAASDEDASESGPEPAEAATGERTDQTQLVSSSRSGIDQPALSSQSVSSAFSSRLSVRVVAVNQNPHLGGLKRQRGGIGSATFDVKQRSLNDFFGRPSPV